ncbi:hypothetical protein SFRURICE_006497 [Spodoptera frugiperda]|nr:hypothetical protein SFRURICE_006497 [Spodoptera frugiperda]
MIEVFLHLQLPNKKKQRHAFYPRKGRQRCTFRHAMPLYNVHPRFTVCVISSIPRATTEKFSNNRKSPAILCSTWESNPSALAKSKV